jgi:hypothetical protein
MGYASAATQPKSFHKPVNSTRSTDHCAKISISADAKAGFESLVKQSACMTLDANPFISLWFEQFP